MSSGRWIDAIFPRFDLVGSSSSLLLKTLFGSLYPLNPPLAARTLLFLGVLSVPWLAGVSLDALAFGVLDGLALGVPALGAAFLALGLAPGTDLGLGLGLPPGTVTELGSFAAEPGRRFAGVTLQ